MNILMVMFVSLFSVAVEAKVNLPAGAAVEETVVVKTHCTMDRVYRLLGYDCSNMNLKEVPQHLKSSVEIFDLSFNRIRELTKKSFSRYSDIKFLYLFDNLIQHIDKGTFSHLTSLEAIDLSINALSYISLELFKLPRLRNLYYNDNNLGSLERDLLKLERPIAAPLQKISIANCRLSMVPDFGILPQLVHLNISLNVFDLITPQQFSPFCSLESLAIENSTELSPCMCKTLKSYFDRRLINLRDPFDCPTIHEEAVYCTGSANQTLDSPVYEDCYVKVLERKRDEQSKQTWKWIMCGLGAFFIAFICVLYYFHRRNVKKAERLEKQSTKLQHIHQTSNGNVEVLLTR